MLGALNFGLVAFLGMVGELFGLIFVAGVGALPVRLAVGERVLAMLGTVDFVPSPVLTTWKLRFRLVLPGTTSVLVDFVGEPGRTGATLSPGGNPW